MPKPKDAETTVMQTIALMLAPLTGVQRERIVRWAYDRYVIVTAAPDPDPDTRRQI